MSNTDTFEGDNNNTSIAHRWMVSMDFSVQANACVDWVLRVMKPNDYLIILNVLNLKAPTYAHDIVINDRLKKESQEKLDEFNKTIKEKGFLNVETVTARGEPSKVICNYANELKIDTIVMGRRGMSNLERVLNGSVSTYVLANAPCAVCLMGKGVEEKIKLEKIDKEIQEAYSSSSEAENEGDRKMPFFLPRKHSTKNYYEDAE